MCRNFKKISSGELEEKTDRRKIKMWCHRSVKKLHECECLILLRWHWGSRGRGLNWEKRKQGCSEKKGIGPKRKVVTAMSSALNFVLSWWRYGRYVSLSLHDQICILDDYLCLDYGEWCVGNQIAWCHGDPVKRVIWYKIFYWFINSLPHFKMSANWKNLSIQ